ncbi:replication initiator protein A [uncultured Lactobacillus sp.]|uniref:replication initiator protein A n=1 Tax=uncultured Lactobacillus sp. TaxID=153152 RepID=UPI00260286B5|nr:replication initiator protein A [uncultured Lactobacillus sp.]
MYTNIRKFKEGGNYPEQQNGLPQAFFHNPKYEKLSPDARYLYMIFTMRMINSQTNGWVDSDGNMYIIYSNQELMNDMHCNSYTVSRLKKELVKHDLLLEENTPPGHANKLYPLRVTNSNK